MDTHVSATDANDVDVIKRKMLDEWITVDRFREDTLLPLVKLIRSWNVKLYY